jgi:hypothetical protein
MTDERDDVAGDNASMDRPPRADPTSFRRLNGVPTEAWWGVRADELVEVSDGRV